MNNPNLISVIIPTKNSEKFLEACLKSIKNQTYKNIEIIVVDNNSTDKTNDIARKYTNLVFTKGRERSEQRKFGGDIAKGRILIHIDSDMILEKNLVKEVNALIEKGFDALVLTERSIGNTFWARCKILEKKFYEGNINIESIRAIKKNIYKKIGGHDKNLVFSEDKDLDLRVRNAGYKISRTKAYVLHDEGDVGFFDLVKKKMLYSNTSHTYANKHPNAFKWQSNIFNRYLIIFKNYIFIFSQPLEYIGLLLLKTFEFSAGGMIYIKSKLLN